MSIQLPSTIQEIEKNNLRCYRIENAHATAEIYAHGAHLTHYQPRGQLPVLWMSERSHFAAGQAIRGGVPLCFPWFGAKLNDANTPAHGLARLSDWRLESAREDEIATELIFVPSPAIVAQNDWPELEIQLRVSIGEQLKIKFEAHNNSASTCRYEIALHSYFAVSDVRQISISGLEDAPYVDKVAFQKHFRWLMPLDETIHNYKPAPFDCAADNTPLHFSGETDRIYLSASTCSLHDEAWQREIVVEKSHSQNTVVWNPWLEKAARMDDFGDDEWPHMVCIETANVGNNSVVLAPDEAHVTSATISVRDLRQNCRVMNNALWGGRFSSGPDAAMARFSTSLPFDSRLWRYDLRGSIAHVSMLERVQVLAPEESAQIRAGLQTIFDDLENGALNFEAAPDEDIHSFVERHLTQRIGAVAGKLHTARSRNDQVALDVRLYLKDALQATIESVKSVQQVLAGRAEQQMGAVLPGYTHLQRAQPVLLSHHLLAYFWMLQRDCERLQHALEHADVLPLGAAAMAGTTFPIDREFVAHELGFARVSENSMDTVASRDHLLESTSALSIIALNLSRLAEEWILWSAPEFGFISLDDRFSTGSSIMPQKKNPDSMELIRGKTARVCGAHNTLMMLVKGLPLTYNRDLQEDKEPLFDAFDTVNDCLEIARGVLETTTFHQEKMRAAAGGGFSTATDVADYLVRLGIPFREAHEITGHAVKFCEDNALTLDDVTIEQWQSIDARIDEKVFAAVDVNNSVAARMSEGGTAMPRVREQLAAAQQLLTE